MTPFDAATAVRFLESAGFTHVIWVPDSFFGTWEEPLLASRMELIRVTREGEAIGLAGGLMLGHALPVVVLQSTGLFEAGDAVRNIVYDLELPLKMLIGLRSYRSWQAGVSRDSAARFALPIINAWQIPYQLIDPYADDVATLRSAIMQLRQSPAAAAILFAE